MLLGKSRKGGVYKDAWIVPGGGIEEGETKLEAAKRETLEEVGIDISGFDVKLLDTVLTGESEKVLRETNEKVIVDMTFYNFTVHADKPSNEIAISCDDDIVEATWHPVSELSKLTLSPPTKTTLQNLGYL
jgi:8-oxo-dGTP diphosphatase